MHNAEIGADIVARVLERRGRLHLFDALDARRTAFVVIDMQNAFCEPGAPVEVPAARGIVPAINRLAGELRRLGGTVVWIRAVVDDRAGMDNWGSYLNVVLGDAAKLDAFIDYIGSGGRGTELWRELDIGADDLKIAKSRYSALAPGTSDLLRALRLRRLDNLLIGGTKTNVCCESTARDAHELDFNVAMVSDCLATLSEREHLATLETFIQQFGDVVTHDEAIAALYNHANRAGSDREQPGPIQGRDA